MQRNNGMFKRNSGKVCGPIIFALLAITLLTFTLVIIWMRTLDYDQSTPRAGNPVHTAGQPWWEATVSYPNVFEDTSFPDRPRFHMLYDGHQVIREAKGYAWSSDLKTWIEYDKGGPHPPNPNPILGVGYTGDAQSAWGDVIKVGNIFYMYYSRGPGTIYHAESTDLINWINLQPIIDSTATTTFGSGVAILKEGGGITPVVVDGMYWMVYFLAYSPGSMHLASSADLLNWTPWIGNPLLTPTSGGWDQDGLWTPSFVRLNDKYYVYYQGNGPAGWETGFASADAYDGDGTLERPDMAIWRKSDPDGDGIPEPVIRHGPYGSWDSDYCIDPVIRQFNGTYYVFYTGNSANGYAYSDSPEGPWTKFGEETHAHVITISFAMLRLSFNTIGDAKKITLKISSALTSRRTRSL